MERLINYWQQLPYHISPDIVKFGAFELRYYSLMYLVAFSFTYGLVMYRIRRENYR